MMKMIYLFVPVCIFTSCQESSEQALKPDDSSAVSSDAAPVKEEVAEPKPEVEVTGDDRYLGLSQEEAAALAKKEGQPFRVVSVDGQPGIITMDHRPERLNFTLVDGKITKVTRG